MKDQSLMTMSQVKVSLYNHIVVPLVSNDFITST